MSKDASPAFMSKIRIELTERFGNKLDDPSETEIVLESDMLDCSIHAWFTLFEKILSYSGFSEYVIMAGATQMAFSEHRREEDMKKIAQEYDLIMKEDKSEDDQTDS